MERPILKPLRVPELLDKAFQIYRGNAILLMGIATLVHFPLAVLHFVNVKYLDASRLIESASNFFLSPFASLALTVAISEIYLGRQASIKAAFSQSRKKYWSVMGNILLFSLAIGVPYAILVLMASGGISTLIVGLIILAPLLIYLVTRWSLYQAAVVLDDGSSAGGLKHSWSLTEGYFWRVFGTSFAAYLITLLFSYLPAIFINYIFSRLLNMPVDLTSLAVNSFQRLIAIFIYPLSIGVNVLIYYDLRIRKEGFDLIAMTDELSAS
jgi:hypothetical protein